MNYQTPVKEEKQGLDQLAGKVGRPRKYNLRESWFENIDLPEKAYVLGLIVADGSLARHSYLISLDLQEDMCFLERVRDLLFPDQDRDIMIRENKINGKAINCLRITSKKMFYDLKGLGVTPNKSLSIKLPLEQVSDKLHSHMIRGLFDGDGSISYTKDGNYRRYSCRISCNKNIAAQLTNRTKVLEFTSHVYPMKNICSWDVRGNRQIEKFGRWMYNNSGGLYMPRKSLKFLGLYTYNQTRKGG